MKLKIFFILLLIYSFLFNQAFAGIIFSEIFPNTIDDTNLEYIELYNSGNLEQSLSGFILKDKGGKEFIFDSLEKLLAGEKKKYLRTQTKIILNNSDEELFLLDDGGRIIDSFSYEDSVKGEVILVNSNIGEEENIEEVFDGESEENGTGNSEENLTGNVETNEIVNDNILIPDLEIQVQSGLVFGYGSTWLCPEEGEGVCKINLNIENSLVGNNSLSDFVCHWDFGYQASYYEGTENNCNPGYVDFPSGIFAIIVKVIDKNNLNNYKTTVISIQNIEVYDEINSNEMNYVGVSKKRKNSDALKHVVNIVKPKIIVQSGLNEKNECSNKNNCSVNFKYNSLSKFEKCLWDFPDGIYEAGTNQKCNPGSVKYSEGEFIVKLKVFEKGNIKNFKESEISFLNGNKISNPGNISIEYNGKNLLNNLIINKVMPNPEGSDKFEFIELINNSNKDFYLYGCSLDDKLDGGSKEYFFEENKLIKPGEKKKYYQELTKLNLNNDTDEVNLFCNNKLIDNLKRDFEIKSGYYLDHSRLDIFSGDANVLEVIDGDTIKIKFLDSGKIEKLRLVGIDAPETKHPDKEIEKYGVEVYEYVKEKLEGKNISVELDSNTLRDKYSRLLGYVFLDDEDFNKKLIEIGYVKTYLNYDFKYIDDYKEAEIISKENELGIWSNGNSINIFEERFDTDNSKKLKADISIQGKIGSNKYLNGNKITCFDSCSINFDGSNSSGNIEKYSWDFGNGEKFEGKNPGYIKYKNYGNYKIYLAVLGDNGELDIGEFNVVFTKSIKKEKLSPVTLTTYTDDDDFITKTSSIEEKIELKNDDNKYIILLYILIILFGLVLTVLILKKEKFV